MKKIAESCHNEKVDLEITAGEWEKEKPARDGKKAAFADSVTQKAIYLVVGIMLIFGILVIAWRIQNGDYNNAGNLGDSFGILNTLFSGVALLILIRTLYLQMEQIKEQQEEYKLLKREQKQLEQRNNCFRLHETWVSEYMRLRRFKAGEAVPGKSLQDQNAGVEEAIYTVAHFIKDIVILYEDDVFDSR